MVLYHFGVPGFGGGFGGVDVFFVISGFLMTGIVVTGLERHGARRFPLWSFYLARARRILPALIVLCAILLVAGWFALTAVDYQLLAKHEPFALSFLSNLQFRREDGYFDISSQEKWLLHTWSLAVEWQFYLLLPLLLMAGWKLWPGRRAATIWMIVALAGSLLVWLYWMATSPMSAFYLLPGRAWEMLAGGLVLLCGARFSGGAPMRWILEFAGLAVIAASTAWVLPGSSWGAPLPVAGAVLVLLAARNPSYWTGNPVAQWLGTRSYSLYLWHWPVFVALMYLEAQNHVPEIAAGLALTLIMGDLSYRWIETPARERLQRRSMLANSAALLSLTIAVAGASTTLWSMHGVSGRLATRTEAVADAGDDKNPRMDSCHPMRGTESPSCTYGGTQLRAIMVGDSHAEALISALAAAAPNDTDGILDWTYTGCPTLLGVKIVPGLSFASDQDCSGFLQWALLQLASLPDNVPVVVVNRSSLYALGHNEPWKMDAGKPLVYFTEKHEHADPAFLREFAEQLTASACELAKSRPVYLMRPIPEMGVDVPRAVSRAMALGKQRDVFVSEQDYRERNAVVWAAQDAARDRCGITILDPTPYLCIAGKCDGVRDGMPIYFDDNHMSESGNKLLVPMFAEVFKARPLVALR